ncbi:MAG: Ldh family oxidoreductase [Candidatus Limnocylindria bacterium]
MTRADALTIDPQILRAYIAKVLATADYPPAAASEISAALVEAELRGISSHGVLHVPNLVKRTNLGLVNPRANIRALSESVSAARLDADRAAGFIAAARAMELAVTKARVTGAGIVVVTNSTHYGMGARYAEIAAQSGMIGLALANATATMPSPGGTQALMGTNPISFAVPGDGKEPVICLDMGLGQVTLNSVRDAMRRGRTLAEGVAAARDGTPTTVPARMLDGGFLLPFGSHKGFGLAVVVEVLTGVLAGAAIGREVGSLFVDYDRAQNTAHFMLAIDPTHFLSLDAFRERRDYLVRWIKDSSRAEGAGPALLPGEREYATRRERLVSGIPLSNETAADLAGVGREVGVDVPAELTRAA